VVLTPGDRVIETARLLRVAMLSRSWTVKLLWEACAGQVSLTRLRAIDAAAEAATAGEIDIICTALSIDRQQLALQTQQGLIMKAAGFAAGMKLPDLPIICIDLIAFFVSPDPKMGNVFGLLRAYLHQNPFEDLIVTAAILQILSERTGLDPFVCWQILAGSISHHQGLGWCGPGFAGYGNECWGTCSLLAVRAGWQHLWH